MFRDRVDVRDIDCPACKSRTRTVPNPFYGAGLSVHQYIVQCVRCDWTRLVKDSTRGVSILRAAEVEPEAVPDDATANVTKLWRFGRG